jgi:hypothetical protein
VKWRKSTRSGSAGDCVEIATPEEASTVFVRDSKDTTGPTLAFATDAWSTFVRGIKTGEFDGE